MEAALNLTPGTFVGTHQHHNHTLRLLHYPPSRDLDVQPRQIRAGAHTDFGSITLLFQDGIDGLEVRKQQQGWMSAPSLPDTILVNTGDLMQRWTNDTFRSTAHRVVLPEGSGTERSRYSGCLFLQSRSNNGNFLPTDLPIP